MENVQHWLQALSDVSGSGLFPFLFWNHCFFICNLVYGHYKKALKHHPQESQDPPFFFGFLTVILMGFGGSMINCLLTGQKQFFFEMDLILGGFFCAWTLILYFPFGLVRILTNNPLSRLFLNVPQGFFTASAIVGSVQLGMKTYPNSVFAPVIMGTIGGTGGGCLFPYVASLYTGDRVTESDLVSPSLYAQVVFLLSIYYNYVTVNGLKPFVVALSPEYKLTLSAEMLMGLVLVFLFQHFVFMDLLGGMFSSSSAAVKGTSSGKGKGGVSNITADLSSSDDLPTPTTSPTSGSSKNSGGGGGSKSGSKGGKQQK